MVLSQLPDASKRPSGENDTLKTESVCPVRVRTNEPSATRHNLMVLSQLPDASKLPSDENDTLVTQSVCPLRVRTGGNRVLASSSPPCLDSLRVRTGGNTVLASSSPPCLDSLRVRTEPSGNRLITHSLMSNIAKTNQTQTQAPYLRRDACAGVGVGGGVGARTGVGAGVVAEADGRGC